MRLITQRYELYDKNFLNLFRVILSLLNVVALSGKMGGEGKPAFDADRKVLDHVPDSGEDGYCGHCW